MYVIHDVNGPIYLSFGSNTHPTGHEIISNHDYCVIICLPTKILYKVRRNSTKLVNEFRFKLFAGIKTHDEISKEMGKRLLRWFCQLCIEDVLQSVDYPFVTHHRLEEIWKREDDNNMTRTFKTSCNWYLLIFDSSTTPIPPRTNKQKTKKKPKKKTTKWHMETICLGRKQHFISTRNSYKIDRLI